MHFFSLLSNFRQTPPPVTGALETCQQLLLFRSHTHKSHGKIRYSYQTRAAGRDQRRRSAGAEERAGPTAQAAGPRAAGRWERARGPRPPGPDRRTGRGLAVAAAARERPQLPGCARSSAAPSGPRAGPSPLSRRRARSRCRPCARPPPGPGPAPARARAPAPCLRFLPQRHGHPRRRHWLAAARPAANRRAGLGERSAGGERGGREHRGWVRGALGQPLHCPVGHGPERPTRRALPEPSRRGGRCGAAAPEMCESASSNRAWGCWVLALRRPRKRGSCAWFLLHVLSHL